MARPSQTGRQSRNSLKPNRPAPKHTTQPVNWSRVSWVSRASTLWIALNSVQPNYASNAAHTQREAQTFHRQISAAAMATKPSAT